MGYEETNDQSRVGPSVPCVAPAGSTAERQTGVIAVARRIVAWVDQELSLREFSEVSVDEGRAIKAHALAIAQEIIRPNGETT